MNKIKDLSITFIIFTYNSSDIIVSTLDHLKAAIDYTPVDNEVILVDNNSTDKTLDIVDQFARDFNFPIRLIKNPRQGLSFSRIEGVRVATKDYVTFIDDDNFIFENWIEVLAKIISEHNPDVIGCQTIGIADVPFPNWWEKYKGNYACGKRFEFDGFLTNPLNKIWGAGLTARLKYLKPALLNMELLCTGRIGNKQMTGEDVEMNYRMRLLGATFYNSNDLVLKHYMRAKRLTKEHLKRTRVGNAIAAVDIDIYRYLLTNSKIYKLHNFAILILIGSIPLSIKYRVNYFKYAFMRFKTMRKRIILQKKIYKVYIDSI